MKIPFWGNAPGKTAPSWVTTFSSSIRGILAGMVLCNFTLIMMLVYLVIRTHGSQFTQPVCTCDLASGTIDPDRKRWPSDCEFRIELEQHLASQTFGLASGDDQSLASWTRPHIIEQLPSRAELIQAITSATIIVGTRQNGILSKASGVIISPEGLVLTAWHVVDELGPSDPVGVFTQQREFFPVTTIVWKNAEYDLVALALASVSKPLPAAPLMASASPGLDIVTMSHPNGRVFTLDKGIITRCFQTRSSWRFSTNTQFCGGSSGGPVFDNRGNVVGLIISLVPSFGTEHILGLQFRDFMEMNFHECSPVNPMPFFSKNP